MIASMDLLEALPVALYTTDAEGHITFFNQAAADMWGHRPPLGSLWCGSWRMYWPDGRPLPHDECPMAVTLKEGYPVRGVEAVAERPDGTRVPFRPYPTPLKDKSGRVIGALNVLIDLSDQKADQARLAAIVTSSDDAIISKTLDGKVTSWNAAATRIFGYESDEMIGQHITKVIPPELHDEEKQILAKLRRGERIDHYETERVAKDGHRINLSLTVSPLRDASGFLIGASKVARDVTGRKQAEKLQQLLIDELNHRVKNTLATVQAIARQSLIHAKNPGDFASSFAGRVQALAKAHSLLTQAKMAGAELTDIVREQVLLDSSSDGRISSSGPQLMLDPQGAVHLALVLHELATNARKYGALSVRGGRLSVEWEMRTNGGRTLLLHWKESGGPKVVAPDKRGFGTALIEQTMRGHGGECSVHYAADGVTCQIELPLSDDVQSKIAGSLTAASSAVPFLPAQDNPSDLLKGKRVLVVENEPLIAMDLESSLMAAGCKVIGPAGTFEEAKLLVDGVNFDVALLDVNLSGRPIDEIAAALSRKNVPFAFATGYGRKALPQAFQEAVILQKPFNHDELLAVVEVLLYLRQQDSDIIPLRRRGVESSNR